MEHKVEDFSKMKADQYGALLAKKVNIESKLSSISSFDENNCINVMVELTYISKIITMLEKDVIEKEQTTQMPLVKLTDMDHNPYGSLEIIHKAMATSTVDKIGICYVFQ